MVTEIEMNEEKTRNENIKEERKRLRLWAKSLTDEYLKELLTNYRERCRGLEIKALINEENRRRKIKLGLQIKGLKEAKIYNGVDELIENEKRI